RSGRPGRAEAGHPRQRHRPGCDPGGRENAESPAWKSIQSEAREREAAGLAALKPVIHGSDIDPAAIQAAARMPSRR
ncbi:hypothetical protein C7E18_23750, partial [Stenotrophomonas maltophilia]